MTVTNNTINCGNLIAGEQVAASSGETSQVLDPATEKTIAEVPVSGDADIERTVSVAQAHRCSVRGDLDRRPDNAELVTGARAPERMSYFLEPTVIAGVNQADEMIRREIFGPIITVQPFRNKSEALRMANDTPYGLHRRSRRMTSDVLSVSVTRCDSAAFG